MSLFEEETRKSYLSILAVIPDAFDPPEWRNEPEEPVKPEPPIFNLCGIVFGGLA